MKIPFRAYPVLVLLAGADLQASGAEVDSPVGVWRGESVCTTGAPACHNEKVVYYIEAVADKPDSVFIRADKLVEGKAVTMGSGPWQYNRARRTLSMESGQRLWLLNIQGKRIEGTLTLPGGVVFRRMTLTED